MDFSTDFGHTRGISKREIMAVCQRDFGTDPDHPLVRSMKFKGFLIDVFFFRAHDFTCLAIQ
jgi:hypothetical protein